MKNKVWAQTKSLFISAGHSDRDPGAVGNGHTEADIVLELRDLVAGVLRHEGLVFKKDGEPGQNLPLSDAVKMAAAHEIAVEFHCNAAENPSATGVETLSQPAEYPLGYVLCETVSRVLGINNRGAKPEGSGQHSRLAFASQGNGVILELFFLSNRKDLEAYQRCKYELAEALAIALAELACGEWD